MPWEMAAAGQDGEAAVRVRGEQAGERRTQRGGPGHALGGIGGSSAS
ncbi:hypothetical protein STANM309S_04549 [Streptomyces tanashiensis]